MTNRRARLLITPSLLNSWKYIWESPKAVRESESDEVSLEDKMEAAGGRAMEEFLKALARERTPATEAQMRGIEYERETYLGRTPASPYVEGGEWQVVGMRRKEILGIPFLLYGRLDCLKCGIVYDIKRVGRYSAQKYLRSSQHKAYLDLFPSAYAFEYLADDGRRLHRERYYRDELGGGIDEDIAHFAKWLEAKGLFEEYASKWKAKGE